MPNQPKTKAYTYRIPEDVHALVVERKERDGLGSDTEVVIAALRAYLAPEDGVSYT